MKWWGFLGDEEELSSDGVSTVTYVQGRLTLATCRVRCTRAVCAGEQNDPVAEVVDLELTAQSLCFWYWGSNLALCVCEAGGGTSTKSLAPAGSLWMLKGLNWKPGDRSPKVIDAIHTQNYADPVSGA